MCELHGHRFKKNASRRDVLRFALAGAGIAALGPLGRGIGVASGAVSTQTHLTIVNMLGGNDSLNMVIPLTLAEYANIRPTLAIAPAATRSLDTGPNPTTLYGLHPAMPNIAALWAEGAVAISNLVGYPNENLSHFESEDIFSYGVRNGFGGTGQPASGWIARYADQYAPTSLGAVSLGVGRRRDFTGGASNPLLVGRLSSFRFTSDGSYPNNHTHRLETVKQILQAHPTTGLSGEARGALDQAHTLVGQIQAAIGSYVSSVTYPTSSPGNYMKDVARLLQAGFPTRVFYTGYGGFDTHGDQGGATGQQANLFARLDGAVGAFAQDMKAMGIWNNTVIVVITEFGRRNYENGSLGTDHGHGYCALVIGGAVNGGNLGPDLSDALLLEEYLPYQVDFRDIYKEILSDHLGAGDLSQVFPETQPSNANLGLVG
jgi:uncharacterized protein (DUF1501 family)